MGRPLRLLLVEDSEDDELLILRALRTGGYELSHLRVETAAALTDALTSESWDLVIADWNLPAFSGLEAFRVFQEHAHDIPFIICSGKVGEDSAVEAMRAGVHDYVMKDNLARLLPAIDRELRDAVVRREHRLAREALQQSEARFTLFMRHLPGAAYIKDSAGRLIYANDYFNATWGSEGDDLIGKTAEDIWPEEIAAAAARTDSEVLASGDTLEMVDTIDVNGEPTVYLTIKFPISQPNELPLLGAIAIDITRRQQAEDSLREATEQLDIERESLQKKNIAMKEVLDQIESDKDLIRQQIATNVEQALLPTIRRLRDAAPEAMRRNLELLEGELLDIASPFLHTLQHKMTRLSPRELEICRLIKNGLTSKEIADLLNLSPSTVQKHRETVRRKLGLTHDHVNLNSYLQSL